MLRKEAIQCVSPLKKKFISNLFLVSKKYRDHRLVINMKSFSKFLLYHHFKMGDLHFINDLLQQNDYMCKIDLKDAYFCVPLQRSSWRFMRFRSEGNLYEFLHLGFGLGPVPNTFTKSMKIPMAVLHRLKNSSYSSFGRHTFVELGGGRNLDGPRYINLSAAASKVCSKHKEIYPSTITGDRISRSADRFSGDDIHFIPGKKFRV